MGRFVRVVLLVAACALFAPAVGQAQVPSPIPTKWGYMELPDGTRLKWSVELPKGKGPFPTLMQYEGYQAGSWVWRATNKKFRDDMLAKGYAIFGVSLRGSACSEGIWELFGKQQAEDGAFAVDWAAEQPWSNGKVATFGYSYGGIMQLWTAAMRPKHLVAAAPGNVVSDTYHDISHPGGIPNVVFPPAWGVALQADWAFAAEQALHEGDATCAGNVALHDDPRTTLLTKILQHPKLDDFHRGHSSVNLVKDIDVPVLGFRTWQDEETGSRQAHYWDQLDPETTWLISGNGNHLVYQDSDAFVPTLEGFFDHYLKGEKNGFEKTPHVQVWHETDVKHSDPRSVTTRSRLPVQLDQAALYFGKDGVLGTAPGAAGTTSYVYPLPAPPVVDTSSQSEQRTLRDNTWSYAPDLPLGRAAFTTPKLENTVTTYGPSSADLWISTTAPDVDVQATVTEVRPDGKEVYINRGWLRASHRATDAARSTDLDPYTVDTPQSLKDMPAGTPQLLRMQVFPFGHTFRPGSSIRVYVEQPSLTGLWGWQSVLTPQTVTVHFGKDHPSRLMLGLLPGANVKPTLPGCDELLAQACRPNPVPQPPGALKLTGTPIPAAITAAEPQIEVRFAGRRAAKRGGVLVSLRAAKKALPRTTVTLLRGTRTIARTRATTVTAAGRDVVLGRRGTIKAGVYTLVVRSAGTMLVRRGVRVSS